MAGLLGAGGLSAAEAATAAGAADAGVATGMGAGAGAGAGGGLFSGMGGLGGMLGTAGGIKSLAQPTPPATSNKQAVQGSAPVRQTNRYSLENSGLTGVGPEKGMEIEVLLKQLADYLQTQGK